MANMTGEVMGEASVNTSSAWMPNELDFVHYLFNVLGIIIGLATLIGNTLIIIAVISEKKLRKVGNVFIISLALSDCLVGIVVSPLAIAYDIRGVWSFGRTLCDFWVSMDVICCTASIMNLCAISYDRCNAILRPIKYSRRRTFSRAWIIVVLLWIYSVLIALPPFLGWSSVQETMYTSDTCHVNREKGYTLFSTIGAFYLPLCFMSYFYFKIYRASCSKKNQWSQVSGSQKFVQQSSLDSQSTTNGSSGSWCTCVWFGKNVPSIEEHPAIMAQASIDVSETAGVSSEQKPETIYEEGEKDTRRESIEPELLAIYQMRQRSKRNCSTVTESSFGSTFMSSSTDSSHTTTTSFSESSDRSLSISTECSGRSSVSTEGGRRLSALRSHRLSSQRHSSLKAEVIHELVASHMAEEDEEEAEPTGAISVFPAAKRSDVDEGNDEESDEPHSRQRPKKLKSSTFRHRNSRKRKRIALSQEKRAAKTLGIVMGCFIICWLPFFIVAVIRPFCTACVFHPLLEKAVIWLGYFNSACNPVIYSFFNKDFRHAFKNMACFKSTHVVHL